MDGSRSPGRKDKIMNRKVLLILADGFRPDALAACGIPLQTDCFPLGATV